MKMVLGFAVLLTSSISFAQNVNQPAKSFLSGLEQISVYKILDFKVVDSTLKPANQDFLLEGENKTLFELTFIGEANLDCWTNEADRQYVVLQGFNKYGGKTLSFHATTKRDPRGNFEENRACPLPSSNQEYKVRWVEDYSEIGPMWTAYEIKAGDFHKSLNIYTKTDWKNGKIKTSI